RREGVRRRPARRPAPRRRSSRPSAALVGRLPCARSRRAVPAHGREPGLVRRPLFRRQPDFRHRRQGAPPVAALSLLALLAQAAAHPAGGQAVTARTAAVAAPRAAAERADAVIRWRPYSLEA